MNDRPVLLSPTPLKPGTPLSVEAEPADLFAPFRTAWNANDDAALPPTSQFIWLNACAAQLADGPLDIIVAEADAQPIAVAGFVARGHGFWRRWTLLGETLYEPADVIYHDTDALDQLLSRSLDRGEPLHFDRLPADSPTIPSLRRQSRSRAKLVFHSRPGNPFIPLDKSWLEPEQHLNSQRRADLRRAKRRAEQHGPVISQILTPSVNELDSLLSTALLVEAQSWKGEEKTALLHDPVRRLFYLRYAKAACRAGILRLCFLRFGDQPVAMQIAVESAGALWLLKIGYDARFARCSPGSLLTRDTIRYAAETGLHMFEFLGDAEPWTQVWTQHEHRCVGVDVYPFTIRGMAFYARSVASALKQKCKRKQP